MSRLKISPDLSLPLDVAGEAIGILATRGAGKSFTSAVLVEELWKAKVQVVVVDPTGVYWGLRAGADGKSDGLPLHILGGAHGDVPLEPTAGALIADVAVDTGQSLILDFSDFGTKAEQTRFVTAFAERLYARKARARTTLHLVIDESDEFAPQKPMKDEPRMLGAMERLVRRGRSRGIGVTLITQRSAAVNKNVLDVIDTLLAMRVPGPRDREAIAGWITAKSLRDELGVLDSLPSLPTGTAWVWSPVRDILQRVAVRRIRTFDSYATPKPGEVRAEPTALAPIDVDKLGKQIAATKEKSEAADPRRLQRRIRELELELEKSRKTLPAKAAEAAARVEYVDVEVPVLTEDDRLQLKETIEIFGRAVEDAMAPLARVAEIANERTQIVHDVLAAAERRLQPGLRPTPARPRHTNPSAQVARKEPHRSAQEAPRAVSVSAGDRDLRLSKSQQRILDALAWFEAVGLFQPRRSPLAAVARTSSKSSGFEKNISTLRTAGLIDYPGPGRVALTDAGRSIAEGPITPPTEQELQEAICSMVSGPQATLLRVLIAVFPKSLTRDELADRAGTSVLSSGFEKNVSTLRSFELVDYPARGEVAALPVLFLEDSAEHVA